MIPVPGVFVTVKGGVLIIADELRRGAEGKFGTVLAGFRGIRVIFVGSIAVDFTRGSEGSSFCVRLPSIWSG